MGPDTEYECTTEPDSAASALSAGLERKWCSYCGTDTHADTECWSTRPRDWQPACHATETLCSTCGNDFRKCVAMRSNV